MVLCKKGDDITPFDGTRLVIAKQPLLVQLDTLLTSIINYKVSQCQAASASPAGHPAHLHYQLQG
jgi:hypothetical protein